MPDAPESLVLLHGFSGTRHAWEEVIARLDAERYRPLALDLPGHGNASAGALADERTAFSSCVASILDAAPERFALCGYSMGGRIALHVALTAPRRVTRLVLISCSPGIDDARERDARRTADERLARELETRPFEQFIASWRTQPLFAEDPSAVRERASAQMRRNDPRALALALRVLGTGAMPSLWGRLGELAMPVTFVAGERDEKYRAIGARAVELVADAELIVIRGGHGLVLESPDALAATLLLL